MIQLMPHFRLQWEEVQHCFVLLYPEGMVKLNPTASTILQLCDGTRSSETILQELSLKFQGYDIKEDVLSFLEVARGKGWIK